MTAIVNTISTLGPFLFVLGVLIFVHELGHFLVARWYGVRVITFSLGFGPKILKITRGGTEYCVSVVPLGGYVKLAGETVEDDRSGAPDEFLSKSKWVRFQVYLAGPVMNLALAILLLAGILLRGADVALWPTSPPVIGEVAKGSAAEKAGLRPGDLIVSVAGRGVENWDDLNLAVGTRANRTLPIVVMRGGQRIVLEATPDSITKWEIGTLGILPVLRTQFTDVVPGKPADRAGMKTGDVVLAVDGQRKMPEDQIVAKLQKSAGIPIVFTVERDGREQDITVTPEAGPTGGLIGVTIRGYEVQRIDPNILQALQMSVKENWFATKAIGSTLAGLFKGDTPVKQLMGPVAIAGLSREAAQRSWLDVLRLMVMLSLNLGLLNLMPVPVLDGGQIAILGFEGLIRRDLSIRVKERILLVGAALIILLMVTVIYNDVARLIR